ncbi:MAG TPA: GFA family protein [Telluria sp.]|nr:GFA family protein [Telluria sp.]
MKANGGCYCGEIRYEVDGDITHGTLCHCVDCRRVSGAPVVGWFTVAEDRVRFVRGAPKWFRSSEHVMRAFCAACGTPIAYRRDSEPGYVDITTCSLDQPELAPPRDHTFHAERLSWMKACDELPKYPRTRSEG